MKANFFQSIEFYNLHFLETGNNKIKRKPRRNFYYPDFYQKIWGLRHLIALELICPNNKLILGRYNTFFETMYIKNEVVVRKQHRKCLKILALLSMKKRLKISEIILLVRNSAYLQLLISSLVVTTLEFKGLMVCPSICVILAGYDHLAPRKLQNQNCLFGGKSWMTSKKATKNRLH